MTPPSQPPLRRLWVIVAAILLAFVLCILTVLHWGGYWLVHSSRLPSHADGAVVLQGGLPSESARIVGAVELLRQGAVDRILISIPTEGFWGSSLPDLARAYLEKQYGNALADRIGFCQTDPSVDSTEQESLYIMPCIQRYHWTSLIVVTSNFHSRRAGIVWRHIWRGVQPPMQLYIDGVPDPLFRPNGWWRHRQYAKTWFLEFTKLIWTLIS